MEQTENDMKIIKFRVMIKEIQIYLMGKVEDRPNECYLVCMELPFIKKYKEQDDFVEAWHDLIGEVTSYCDEEDYKRRNTDRSGNYIIDAVEDLCNLSSVVGTYSCYKCCDGGWGSDEISPVALRNNLIFWALFLAAINDDIYNNELIGIIDLAYCLKFNEAMIRDWCKAVEYVLSGNQLKEGCDLQCETEEGKEYFLHA